MKNKTTKNKQTKTKFRVNAKKLFLTYPQTGVSAAETLKQLEKILDTWVIDSYFIVREKHEKDGNHIHAFIELDRKCNITRQDYLDLIESEIDGREKKIHGNYQSAKNPEGLLRYLSKDTMVNENDFVISKDLASRLSKKKGMEDIDVATIRLAKEGRIEDAMDLIERYRPKSYARSHMSIERSFRDMYRKTKQIKPKYKANDFTVPQALEDFLNQQKENQYEKTIIIFGRPNTGKTQFVQTYLDNEDKRYLYARDLNDLAQFENSVHEFIILDDCDKLSNLSREAILSILGAEDQGSIRILYQAVQIPSGTGRIIICNELDYAIPRYFQSLPEVKRRFVAFEIKDSLKAKKQSLLTEADPYDKLVSPTDQESYPPAKG
jgi:hypothetical protein